MKYNPCCTVKYLPINISIQKLHSLELYSGSNLASIHYEAEDEWIREQMTLASTLPEVRAYWIGFIKDGAREFKTITSHLNTILFYFPEFDGHHSL